ncbi:hypothetical protein DFH09DRAFT_1086154 [Mycena vulgaris]|nr:hypothetical protein DFH09DRAFT_1086154 [Mycena vulgaris]
MSSSSTLLHMALSVSAKVNTLRAEIEDRQERLKLEEEALILADKALEDRINGLNKEIATASATLAGIVNANSIIKVQVQLRKDNLDHVWTRAESSLGVKAASCANVLKALKARRNPCGRLTLGKAKLIVSTENKTAVKKASVKLSLKARNLKKAASRALASAQARKLEVWLCFQGHAADFDNSSSTNEYNGGLRTTSTGIFSLKTKR